MPNCGKDKNSTGLAISRARYPLFGKFPFPVRIDPNVLFSLAEALGDQGSLQEAEAAYLKAIPLYQQLQDRGTAVGATYRPNIALSLNNLAIIYSREKRFDEAGAAIERALASWPTPRSTPATFFVTRGIVFEGQHKTTQASVSLLRRVRHVLRRIPMLCSTSVFC